MVVVAYEQTNANDILVVNATEGTTLSFKDQFGIFPTMDPPEKHGAARVGGDGTLAAALAG